MKKRGGKQDLISTEMLCAQTDILRARKGNWLEAKMNFL